MHILRFFLVIVFSQSLVFSNILWASEQLSLPTPDITAPEVAHEPVTDPIAIDSTLTLQATVTDNVGVKSVTLFYRVIGDENYQQLNMKKIGWTDTYSSNIENVPTPGIEYFIQAEDLAGNTLLHGYSFSPLVVKAQTPSMPPPAEEIVSVEKATPEEVTDQPKKTSKTKKWVWIGLGVLAVGAIAAAASGDGNGGDDEGTVVVSSPTPQ